MHTKIKGLRTKYIELYTITKNTLSNPQLWPYIFYSGTVAATTMVFVWSFQPLMQMSDIPVAWFGVIYFINHICRAGASFFLPQTVQHFSLENIGKLTYGLYLLSFIAVIIITQVQNPFLGMSFLSFICIAIGFQLTFTLASISRLHTLVPSEVRSTSSSVNNLVSRFMAGFMLILFKFVLDGITIEKSFIIYMMLFSISILPLYKLLRLSRESADVKMFN